MANIGVKPARKGMNLVHPLDGLLPDEGGSWREDQFTLKRLRDKDIKRVEADVDEVDDADASSAKPSRQKRSGRKASEASSDAAEAPLHDPVSDPAVPPAPALAQE